MRFPLNLITGLFNTPVALAESSAPLVMQLLDQVGKLEAETPVGTPEREWGMPRNERAEACPYDIICGVAVIPVKGILIQRLGWLWHYGDWLGVSGYDRIRYQFMHALANDAVDAIAFDIDSGGGDVAGCFDLVDTIYGGRGIKPIAAILGENAFSAAYAIASAVDPKRLWVPRTGGTGSVGVIYIHLSIAGYLKQMGVTPTLITKGNLKGEGSEMIALSDDARERFQRDVDTVGRLFDETVARNRGMTRKQVFDTQAGTFLGADGVDIGFADAVAAPDEAFRALLKQL